MVNWLGQRAIEEQSRCRSCENEDEVMAGGFINVTSVAGLVVRLKLHRSRERTCGLIQSWTLVSSRLPTASMGSN
jgi:hypothetical protein